MTKKLLSLALCAALLLSGMPSAFAASQTFTLMIYLCGTDLESDAGAATADLQEMIEAGVPQNGNLTVYIQTGGTKSWHTRGISDRKAERWTLSERGLTKVDSVGSVNMGDASTLADFLVYGFQNYPADRYGLILWDHGSGASGGLCYDEMKGDPLYYPEIYEGLENACRQAGISQKFAFIGFDACLMASYEMANHLAPFADYMIASEELEPGSGWAYDEWLGYLAEDPGIDIPTLGKQIVDSFIKSNSGFFRGDYATLSVCDLSCLDALKDAVEELGASLTAELKNDFAGISRLRQNMRSFGEVSSDVASDMIDLTVFADVYARYNAEAARQLKSALDDVVVYSRYTSNLSNVSGMSILVPYATRSDFSSYLPYYETQNLSPNYSAFVKGMAQQMTSGSTSGIWGNIGVSQQSIQEAQVDWFGQYAQDQDAYSENASSLWDEWYGSDTEESSDFSLSGFLNYLFSEDDSSYNSDYDSSSSGLWGDLDDDADTSFATDDSTSLEDFINSLLGEDEDEDTPQQSAAVPGAVTVQTGDGDVTLDNPFAGTSSDYAYTVSLTPEQLSCLGKVEANLMMDVSDPDFECYVELGYVQDVITDWNNGKIYGLFDGTWAMLDGQMVCTYDQIANEKYIRSLIPVTVNGHDTYLLVIFDESTPGGRVAGYTDGYTEAGLPARQVWDLEPGDVVVPQYSLLYWDEDGEQQEEPFEGDPITVGRDGSIPFAIDAVESDADYVYGFCLTDIYGDSTFTDFTSISF